MLAHRLNLDDGDNRRVQWDLQPRVIRYYTTQGLLDRASEKRGKSMYYGARHLFQLLAIKKLQGMGLSLAQIQPKLLGASDEEMARFLEMPEGWLEIVQEHSLAPSALAPQPEENERERDFWLQPGPLPTQAAPTETIYRFRLPGGVEVLIPQQAWEQHDTELWQQWLSQAPS
ncbi:MerR family transcriptional regulator [bacterium]|nr:MerR family transcriptional regulator [bacterium]